MKKLEDSKSPHPKTKFSKSFLLSSILLSILLLLLLLFLTTATTALLLQQNIISFVSPNRIYLPPGKVLHDLNILTYRNHTLFKMETAHLVLNEDEEYDTTMSIDENDDFIVTMTTLHSDDEESYNVPCSATCNCYEDLNDGVMNRKSASSLLYSYRYSAIVIISILGLASAKFVGDHLDNCYESARNVIGDDRSITCYFDDSHCGDRMDMGYVIPDYDHTVGKKNKHFDQWECIGHCLTSHRIRHWYRKNPEALKLFKEMSCESRVCHKIFDTPKMGGMVMKGADEYYIIQYLYPFCRQYVTEQFKNEELEMWDVAYPCEAESSKCPRWKHIRCEHHPKTAY